MRLLPSESIGAIDLSPPNRIGGPSVALIAMPEHAALRREYEPVGCGDCREIGADRRLRDAWQALAGFRPEGERLADLLWDQFTRGSDPRGIDAPAPLVPGSLGRMELHMPGTGLVRRQRFRFDLPHADRVIDVFREQYRAARGDALRGLAPAGHHRRLLDFWGRQYRIDRPQRFFVPPDLEPETPLPHSTAFTDDFNRPDAPTLGTSSSGPAWTQSAGLWSVSGGRGGYSNTTTEDIARLDGDLSSSDHRAQFVVEVATHVSGAMNCDVLTRMQSDDLDTSYRFNLVKNDSDPGGARRFFKVVAGLHTQLSGLIAVPHTPGEVFRGTSDGTLHTLSVDDVDHFSTFDTAINVGFRCGLRGAANNTQQTFEIDDYQCEDLQLPTAILRRRRAAAGLFS